MAEEQQQKKRRRGQSMTKAELKQAKKVFLEAFAATANTLISAKKANVHRTTIYQWLEHDEDFSMEYKQAELDACDVIRAELFRRAVQGVEEPVVSAGRLVRNPDGSVLTVKKYSDALMSSLAKARLPEFREKQTVEVTGKDEGSVKVQRTVDYSQLSDEEFKLVEAIARRVHGSIGN